MEYAKLIYHIASLYLNCRTGTGHLVAIYKIVFNLDDNWFEEVQVPGP